jgi:osmotically-inducible protein OsmY
MKAVLMSGLLGMALLAGCTQTDNQRVQQQVQGARQEFNQGMDQAKKAANDKMLAGKVKQYLLARKGLDARSINVDAKGTAITLKGDVASTEQAQMAEQAAREVQGVETVTNQLTMHVPAAPASANPPESVPTTR